MGHECRYSASTNEQNVNANSATFTALSLKLKSRFPAKRVVCTSNKQEKKHLTETCAVNRAGTASD